MTAPTNPPLILTSDLTPSTNFSSSNTADLIKVIVSASRQVEQETGRYFAPRIMTRYFDGHDFGRKGGDALGLELRLDRDLQSTSPTITNGDSDALASDEYTLAPRNSETGKTIIRLKPNGSIFWTNDVNDYESVSVAGTWCYGGQWKSTGLTASAIASTSTTSITVSSATILAGSILQIDSEVLYVESGSSTTLTVVRGYLGSTAATHLDATAVSRWECDSQVLALVSRIVGTMLGRYQSPLFGQVAIGDLSIPITVDKLPDDIRLMLSSLRFNVPILAV